MVLGPQGIKRMEGKGKDRQQNHLCTLTLERGMDKPQSCSIKGPGRAYYRLQLSCSKAATMQDLEMHQHNSFQLWKSSAVHTPLGSIQKIAENTQCIPSPHSSFFRPLRDQLAVAMDQEHWSGPHRSSSTKVHAPAVAPKGGVLLVGPLPEVVACQPQDAKVWHHI